MRTSSKALPSPSTAKETAPVPLKPLPFLFLVCLADGERHGYALKKEVARRTDGKVRPGPATLYRTLATMIARGWIEESARRPAPELDDERRRYYRITESGRHALVAELRRLEGLVSAARVALREQGQEG